jgi:predicted peptidase
MGQAPAEVQALLREHTTTHQVNELHYLKKLPGTTSGDGSPVIVFLHGVGERGPADGSELDRACMHGPLKVALAGPSDSPGLPGTLLDGFIILNPQLCAAPCLPASASARILAGSAEA